MEAAIQIMDQVEAWLAAGITPGEADDAYGSSPYECPALDDTRAAWAKLQALGLALPYVAPDEECCYPAYPTMQAYDAYLDERRAKRDEEEDRQVCPRCGQVAWTHQPTRDEPGCQPPPPPFYDQMCPWCAADAGDHEPTAGGPGCPTDEPDHFEPEPAPAAPAPKKAQMSLF